MKPWGHGHAREHLGVISPEKDAAVVDNPKQSSGFLLDTVDDHHVGPANPDRPTPARAAKAAGGAGVPSRVAVIGLAITTLVVVGLWLAVGEVWSTVAGQQDASPMWPGVVYGAGSLTSVLALSRPGIVNIPRNLRQVELPASLRAPIGIFLILLHFIAGVLLPRLTGL